jgi:hypothetical protein
MSLPRAAMILFFHSRWLQIPEACRDALWMLAVYKISLYGATAAYSWAEEPI